MHHLPGLAGIEPLPGITDPCRRLLHHVGGHPALAEVICHGAKLAAERKQPLRHPPLSAGRLLLHLALSLLEQVPALTPGLRRDIRGLLPGNIGHVLSRLNTAVAQV